MIMDFMIQNAIHVCEDYSIRIWIFKEFHIGAFGYKYNLSVEIIIYVVVVVCLVLINCRSMAPRKASSSQSFDASKFVSFVTQERYMSQ